MDHSHPHVGSGMNFAAAGFALLGGISVQASNAVASASAWSFDDVKWGMSLAVSFTFGAVGVYTHIVERMDKAKYKRQMAETRARLDREELEADSRRRRERADIEERIAVERIAAEVRRRTEVGEYPVAAEATATVAAVAVTPDGDAK
jgi:hypothetical protein